MNARDGQSCRGSHTTRTYAIRSALTSTLGVAIALTSGSALAASFRLTDLGTLGGSFTEGVALNASGQVAGISETTDGALHGFLWDGTTLQDLGALGGSPFNRSLAINASGQVTGTDFNADDENAFLWDGTALHDLNALIDPADPLQPFITLFAGVDINDLGQILANGIDSRTGESHAYVVSPFSVPESGTLALLGLGLAGLGIARRRRAA